MQFFLSIYTLGILNTKADSKRVLLMWNKNTKCIINLWSWNHLFVCLKKWRLFINRIFLCFFLRNRWKQIKNISSEYPLQISCRYNNSYGQENLSNFFNCNLRISAHHLSVDFLCKFFLRFKSIRFGNSIKSYNESMYLKLSVFLLYYTFINPKKA